MIEILGRIPAFVWTGNILETNENDNEQTGAQGEAEAGEWKIDFVETPDFKYQGEFLNSLKHGKGIQIFISDGSRYDGSWKHGQQNGHGRLINSDGDIYQGNFING